MLNFLIAVISQSYENVMNNKTILKYQDIAALNKEAYMFMNNIRCRWSSEDSLINNNRILLSLKADENLDEESSEWNGIVSTMKTFTKYENARTNEVIVKNQKKTGLKIGIIKSEINSKMIGMDSKMSAIESKIDTEMGSMKS